MSKIVLSDTNSGYNLTNINDNFNKVEEEFQDKVLYRNNPEGEPNDMHNNLDMNGNRILNLPEPINENEAARLKDIQDAVAGGSANQIKFSPTPEILSENVQAAIEEVDAKTDGSLRTDLANTEDVTKGAALSSFVRSLAYASDTVGSKLRERISILDFGAVGDGVTDDTAAIQAAIDNVHDNGGGEVFFPAYGRQYVITDTIWLYDNICITGEILPGFFLPANGTRIICKFTNPNKWAFESNTFRISDLTRVPYREAITGAQIDVGTYNHNHNIGIKNLYITVPGDDLYGAIRLMGCPGSVIEQVAVNGADIGFCISASWGVTVRGCWSWTHCYGFAAVYDVNGLELQGYFNCYLPKTVDNSNRPVWIDAGLDGTKQTRNILNERIGVYLYFTQAVDIHRLIAEQWQVGRAYVNATATVENAGYSEGNTGTTLALVAGDFIGNGMYGFDTTIVGNSYEFGLNCKATITNYPAKAANYSSFCFVKLNESYPDVYGWTYSDRVKFDEISSTYRVSNTGSSTNIATTDSYTTLDEALRRIALRGPGKYTIAIKGGDTVSYSGTYYFNDTQIDIKSDTATSVGITSLLGGGVPVQLVFSGNSGVSLNNVVIGFGAGTPSNVYNRACIVPARQAYSSTFRFSAVNSVFNLGASYGIFQQAFNSSSVLNTSFVGCTITGSGTACIMVNASANSANSVVTNSVYSTTTSASVIAFGTNGWMNSTILNSNFV